MKKYLSLIISSLLFILISLPNNSFGVVFFLGDEVYVIPNPTGFTAKMLDASPTYYATDSVDNGGTKQSTYKFSGTGPYVLTVTDEYFDASDVSQGQETLGHNCTLNADGTLTVTEQGEPGSTIVSLTSKTNTYLNVHGVFDGGTETWDETWFLAEPEGWLTSDGTPSVFTAEMLNAGPTYYVTYDGDPDGTTTAGKTQETLVVSGTGPYVVTVTMEYFNDSGVSQGTGTDEANIVLNADGTLTATVQGEPGETIITLTAETDTYLLVNGVNGTETWDDYWFLAEPEGWL